MYYKVWGKYAKIPQSDSELQPFAHQQVQHCDNQQQVCPDTVASITYSYGIP
jgi:hypothetical protein